METARRPERVALPRPFGICRTLDVALEIARQGQELAFNFLIELADGTIESVLHHCRLSLAQLSGPDELQSGQECEHQRAKHDDQERPVPLQEGPRHDVHGPHLFRAEVGPLMATEAIGSCIGQFVPIVFLEERDSAPVVVEEVGR